MSATHGPGSEDGEGTPEKAVLRIPACDNCKARKIKCDRNTPCSSCIASKISCRTTKRPPEKRQRVLLSKNHGDEIADVNKRLSDLSSTIHALVESSNRATQASDPTVHTVSTLASVRNNDQQESDTPYEGDTSFTSHSKTIAEALGALNSPPYSSDNIPLPTGSAVQKLLEDVAASTRLQPVVSSPMGHYPELAQQSLPSMTSVLKLLRLADEVTQRLFIEWPFLTVKDFADLCQKVYFATKEYSIATWMVVNAGLCYLFRDLDEKYLPQVGIGRDEGQAFVDLCSSNVLTCVQSLRLTLEASLDNVEALALAASWSMELAKASLAWKLTAAAARLCLDLGIHRQRPDSRGPQARRERLLFWFVYAMDKGFALNFGRTPNIHDYDMTIERPKVPDDVDGPLADHYLGWLDFAQIEVVMLVSETYPASSHLGSPSPQNDIVLTTLQQLFCVVAQRQPQDVRTSRAHALAARCVDLQSRLVEFDVGEGQFETVRREALLLTDIVIYSLLTLIYRTISPPPDAHALQFSDECVIAARQALKHLAEAWQEIQPKDDHAWRLFVNWTVLFVPFVPFIIVFGNTIAQKSRQDLLLLEGAVHTLRGASQTAPAVSKLRDACEKFCQIAAAYLAQEATGHSQAQSMHAEDEGTSIGSGVDVPLTSNMGHSGPIDFQALSDYPMQQGAWDGMLNEWELGLGVENAREMTDWFGQYMSGGGQGFK